MRKRYVIKCMDLYVSSIGEGYLDLVKEIPKYGLTDNLNYAQKQKRFLKKLMGIDGEIFEKKTFTKKRCVTLEEATDLENTDEKYYIFENDNLQAVKRIEDTGDIELSFQQSYKMAKVYQIERVIKRLEEYGLEGYKLHEVTIHTEIEKVN